MSNDFRRLAEFLCHTGEPSNLAEIGKAEFETLNKFLQCETPSELLNYLQFHTIQQTVIFDF
jgi:hypothetical protein